MLRDAAEGDDAPAVRIARAYVAAQDRAFAGWDWRSDPYGWEFDLWGDAERAAQAADDAIRGEAR